MLGDQEKSLYEKNFESPKSRTFFNLNFFPPIFIGSYRTRGATEMAGHSFQSLFDP